MGTGGLWFARGLGTAIRYSESGIDAHGPLRDLFQFYIYPRGEDEGDRDKAVGSIIRKEAEQQLTWLFRSANRGRLCGLGGA